MGKRHLTPQQIKEQCKAIAREKRMADRTPWSAMNVMCSYVIMKCEGFKGERILKLTNRINEMEAEWSAGKIDLKQISDKLYEVADWTIEHNTYKESDIRQKKGTYLYWLDSVQIEPQNTINEQATRYMLFFFTALMDLHGYRKKRLSRVCDYLNNLLEDYQKDKTTVHAWKRALLEEAGVLVEMPIDPLTQTRGSLMTG